MQHSKLYRMIRTFGLVAVFALTASSLTMPSCAYVFEGLGITLQGKTPWTARPHGRFEKLTLIGPYGVTVRITPLNNNKPCSILFS